MDKIRVLLAEDHVIVPEGTGQLVQREPDMEIVGEASDGKGAVKLAERLPLYNRLCGKIIRW